MLSVTYFTKYMTFTSETLVIMVAVNIGEDEDYCHRLNYS